MPVLAQGVDFSFDHPTVAQLRAAGKRFVIRYVYPASQALGTKNLSRAEADSYKANGIRIVSNYESWAGRARDGFAAGQADAGAAHSHHVACGGPTNRPIFFSVDFDTNTSWYDEVDAYFAGVASVLGVARTGVYGEYEIVKHLMDTGRVGPSATRGMFYAWQTYAWSAGQYDERCCLAQDRNGVALGSGTVDLDSAHAADYGQWDFSPEGFLMALTDRQQTDLYNDVQAIRAFVEQIPVAQGQTSRGATLGAVLPALQNLYNDLPGRAGLGVQQVLTSQTGQDKLAQAALKAVTQANVALETDVNAALTSLERDLNAAVATILQQLQTGGIDVPALASAIATNLGPNMGNELVTALKNALSD